MILTTGKRGFSLVEILVVISIIALLAGMTMAGIMKSRNTVNRANTKIILDSVRTGLKTYYTDCGMFPIDNKRVGGVGIPAGSVADSWVYSLMREGKSPPYLDGIEDKSLELSSDSGQIFDVWGAPIKFRVVGAGTSLRDYKKISAVFNQAFFVWSIAEDGTDQMDAGYQTDHNWNILASDWQNFSKLQDPALWMDDNHGDDIIVGN